MRRHRRKGGNKEKVFGCDLMEHLTASSQEIPLVLRCCSKFVEKHGIVDGIYRLSGVSSNIQKLRGEFEGDGSPDLNKDVYLQDIHCISSLCKAYFRELPNPLLTYQLYDKFAEAVAIQLEEERLVKIRDVLKELPTQHQRTLEFLMRHLVRMASYSSETNMHARNLAIVWAPNLLRSKDIEVSGFNGTAAFMEVRVQSIVVEFILTHVPQLFPTQGGNERRSSLPSPTPASCAVEGPFKSVPSQPVTNIGNISPGDGPLPMRPYHAIIEGTDKRKGSLKGRKWMSIFNIGGRFHDQRRRHKNSAKEKDRQSLRPARSMDSLSTAPYPNEVSRCPAQRPPSSTSPLIAAPSQAGSDVSQSTGGLGGSEYAVTYRRGTGLVSGGSGTQGTYTALDPEGLGVTGSETLQSRSPGLSTKVGRRAAMHITGPTIVTVPLHITSNLALGVLQGGGADRVIHRGREKDGGDRVEGKEGRERKESIVLMRKAKEVRKAEEEEINHKGSEIDKESAIDTEKDPEEGADEEEDCEGSRKEEEETGKERLEVSRDEPVLVKGGEGVSWEKRAKSLSSNAEKEDEEDAVDEDMGIDDEYMEMKHGIPDDFQSEETQQADVFDASGFLNSTEIEGDDMGLSGYVQDNFDFLDQMDCSVMDHVDCGVSYQVNEFSVEPPGHSDDEYEVMEQYHPTEENNDQQHVHEKHTQSPTELHTHRPLRLDSQSRHTKSLSLPYRTSPVHEPEDSDSEDDTDEDEGEEYSSEDDESMFAKSLPCDFFLKDLSVSNPNTDRTDICTSDGLAVHELQISGESDSLNSKCCAHKLTEDGEQELEELKDNEGSIALEENEMIDKEDDVQQEEKQLQNESSGAEEQDSSVWEDTQSDEEQLPQLVASPHGCAEVPLQSKEELNLLDSHEDSQSDFPLPVVDDPLEEIKNFSVRATEEPGCIVRAHIKEKDVDDGEETNVSKEKGGIFGEMAQGIKEQNENMIEDGDGLIEGRRQKGAEEDDSVIQDVLEDVVCEVIEYEESVENEKNVSRESTDEEDEEQITDTSREKDIKEGGENETEDGIETEKETAEEAVDKLTDPEVQKECEDSEIDPPLISEPEERSEVFNDDVQRHDEEKVILGKKKDDIDIKRADEEHETIDREEKEQKHVASHRMELKDDKNNEVSHSRKGGVGRKIVVSKQPKFYQVKAVPVVPPKPQHCKITAMNLRQQQQKERRDPDRERENTHSLEGDKEVDLAQEEEEEMPVFLRGDRERERRSFMEGESLSREINRSSPLSMNFEEAVAMATMKRGMEKECEKEKQRDWGNDVQ